MNRLLLFCSALLMSLAASAEYSYLVFTTDSGEKHSMSVEGLEIAVSGDNLVVTNTNAGEETLTLALGTLASMEFSNESAGVGDAALEVSAPFAICNLEGIELGQFDSLSQAKSTLAPGVYLMTKTNGETVKILIGK